MAHEGGPVGARLLAAWLRTTGELQAVLDHYVLHGPAAIESLTHHLRRVEQLEGRAHQEWRAYRDHVASDRGA